MTAMHPVKFTEHQKKQHSVPLRMKIAIAMHQVYFSYRMHIYSRMFENIQEYSKLFQNGQTRFWVVKYIFV